MSKFNKPDAWDRGFEAGYQSALEQIVTTYLLKDPETDSGEAAREAVTIACKNLDKYTLDRLVRRYNSKEVSA